MLRNRTIRAAGAPVGPQGQPQCGDGEQGGRAGAPASDTHRCTKGLNLAFITVHIILYIYI